MLDRGADQIETDLAAAPEAQLRLDGLLAQMYVGMALNERGLALQRRGLALATRLHGSASAQALDAAADVGMGLDDLGRRDEALAVLLAADAAATLARAIALAEKVGDPHTLHIARYKLSRFQYENRLLHEALASAGSEAAWARGLRPDQEFGDLSAVVMVNAGRILVAYGDAAGGLAALDAAFGLLPQQTPGRLGPLLAARADALVALGRLPEADADLRRAVAATVAAGPRSAEAVRAVRRRYLVAAGRAEEALRDLATDPMPATPPLLRLRRDAEEATLLLAAGRFADAQAAAQAVRARNDGWPERRFVGGVEADRNAVLGEALLQDDRIDALPVLKRARTLCAAEYDPVKSAAVRRVREALAEAERRSAR